MVEFEESDLDEIAAQPLAGGGPALKFPSPGTAYTGVVAREIVNSDVEQQVDPATGRPEFFRDGRPKLQMRVPIKLRALPGYPHGTAEWYVREQARDALVHAMAYAGARPGPPEAGAGIHVGYVGDRRTFNGHPMKIYDALYLPPTAERRTLVLQAERLLDSPAEVAFWTAYRDLRPPALDGLVPQHEVRPYRLDFAVPQLMVGVEIDGRIHHSSPQAFQRDRVRQRDLEFTGWRIVRFTGREALDTPAECVSLTADFAARFGRSVA